MFRNNKKYQFSRIDEIDFLIVRNLIYNSRLTYKELAETINMSVSAIHKCIKTLEEERDINTFIARPSL